MMPRPCAASSGSSDSVIPHMLRAWCVTRPSAQLTLSVLAAALLSLSGCCCTDEGLDHALKRTEARLAYTEPCDCSIPAGVGADYERGWRAGYLDVSEGRSGTPPVVPPHRYRTYKYQTGVGRQAAAAWYQGFAAGAAAAKCQGLDNANRVFAVESPCMACEGQCECSMPGVLPTAEAMLRRQQYRNGGQIVIEHELPHGAVPTPAPASSPSILLTPEQVEPPAQSAPSTDASSSVRPLVPAETVGPALKMADTPAGESEPPCLVGRDVSPPSPVELPSSVTPEPKLIKTPVADTPAVVVTPPKSEIPRRAVNQQPLAEATVVKAPAVKPHSDAVIAPAPPVKLSPVAKRSPATVATKVAQQPERATQSDRAMPTPPHPPRAMAQAPDTDSENLPSLAQPKALTSLDHKSTPAPTRKSRAPLPRVIVKTKPVVKPLAKEPELPANASPLKPPKQFPLAETREQDSAQPVTPQIAVPDEIGFPAPLIPSTEQHKSSSVAKVKPVGSPRPPKPLRLVGPRDTQKVTPEIAVPDELGFASEHLPTKQQTAPAASRVKSTANGPAEPKPFASVSSQPESQKQEVLQLPASAYGTPSVERAPNKAVTPRRRTPRTSLLPKRLADVPAKLSQPKGLLTTVPLDEPCHLAYPDDISYSLHDHNLQDVATPLQLMQPTRIQPATPQAEVSYDIQFDKTVWPVSFQFDAPPTQ